MWYAPVVTAAPAEEPVSVDDAKNWGRVESSDDNARLEGALLAARGWVESFTGTWLAEQTVTIKCDCFADFNSIPLAPVQSVSISYKDSEGADRTLEDTVYDLRAEGLEASIVLKSGQSWPGVLNGSRISVAAVCGYVEMPPELLQAIKLLAVSDFDGTRNDDTITTVQALLANHRRFI